jgi:hypothetical protein
LAEIGIRAYGSVSEKRRTPTNDRHQGLFGPAPTTGRGQQRLEPSVCDYSLHHLASRPAKVGDKLVTAKFVNTPTGGFAAGDNPNVAVCCFRAASLPLTKTSNASRRWAFFEDATPAMARRPWGSLVE